MAQIVLPVSPMSQRADAGARSEKRSCNGWLTALFTAASRLLNKHWSSVLPPAEALSNVMEDGRLFRCGDLVTPRQLGQGNLAMMSSLLIFFA